MCNCSSCSQSINPYLRVAELEVEALDALGNLLLQSESSSSGSAGPPCFSQEDFLKLVAQALAEIDRPDTDAEQTSPTIGTLGSPANKLYTGWATKALNNFCTGNGFVGYTDWQASIISMVLGQIMCVPFDLLPCFCNQAEALINEAPVSSLEKRPLLIAQAAVKGATYYWDFQSDFEDDRNKVWPPLLNENRGIRASNIPFYAAAAYFGALTIFPGSVAGSMPALTAEADIVLAVVGSSTVTAAAVSQKAIPGFQIS